MECCREDADTTLQSSGDIQARHRPSSGSGGCLDVNKDFLAALDGLNKAKAPVVVSCFDQSDESHLMGTRKRSAEHILMGEDGRSL